MSTDGALQYIDKTLSNLAENADDILWVNPEVVELVMDIRKELTDAGVHVEPPDAQVEAAAHALAISNGLDWSLVSEARRDGIRAHARAALQAARVER